MNTSVRMIIVLTVIAVLAGGILSTWDGITRPKIAQHRLEELKAAIAEVLPAYDYYDQVEAGETTFYIGRRNNVEAPVGIAFKAEGSGFQGKITMMVGLKPDFETLTGIKVLEQIETPGLGNKISVDPSNKENPYWFAEQFRGVQTAPEITVVKNRKPTKNTEIEAISGATISSRAVVRILNETIRKAKQLYLINRNRDGNRNG
ncbi:MAG: RnfABCDGE type electron transport complex subunit G [FCB group bacterium]|nr:RnfABCDGE type electron transport complex subunit G [FCB group bacterium]